MLISIDNIKKSLQSNEFISFYNNTTSEKTKNNFIVGILSSKDQELLRAKSSNVLLSMASLHGHKTKHKDILLADYQKLPEIIASGEIYQKLPNQKPRKYILLQVGEFTYRAALKITADKSENYLTSLIKQSDIKANIEIRNKYQKIR